MHHKKHTVLSHIRHTGILVLFIFALLTYFFFSRSSQRQNTNSQAAGNTLKVMTFNVLGGDLCRNPDGTKRNHTAEVHSIANLIMNTGIGMAGLQEVTRLVDSCQDFDMVEDYKGFFGTRTPRYTVSDHRYFGSNDRRGYRVFVHTGVTQVGSVIQTSTDVTNKKGAEIVVMDTPVGRVRFIHVHPGPGTEALTLDTMLLPLIEQYRGDGIPMILMGDFNLRYTQGDPALPVLQRIENAGFYRACDPAKFPNGRCHDTVSGSSEYDIDHIFIDRRARFYVKNAYVEQSIRFSDHLPVIAELTTEIPTPTTTTQLPNPTGLTRVCNTNGTATFRWNAVSGAGEYAFRLDEQGTNPSSPIHNWKTSPPDIAMNTSSTTATVNVTPGRYYQWAVTAVRTPGTTHPFPTWQPAFTCAIATSTPTRIPPTATRTPTKVPPTATRTPTRSPVITNTPTRIPPTATRTPTRLPPTATRTPPTPTRTPTRIPSIGPPTITPTRTPTPRIITATPVASCTQRSRGDADCNGRVDIIDFICWKDEFIYRRKPSNCQTADFNRLNGVDLIDFTIWKQEFL